LTFLSRHSRECGDPRVQERVVKRVNLFASLHSGTIWHSEPGAAAPGAVSADRAIPSEKSRRQDVVNKNGELAN
jgi:hypothetical protein